MPALKNITNAVKRAVAALGPGRYEIGGQIIKCPHCGQGTFETGEAQLNTSLMTFFNLDWLDESATVWKKIKTGHDSSRARLHCSLSHAEPFAGGPTGLRVRAARLANDRVGLA